jgi:PmbA protein
MSELLEIGDRIVALARPGEQVEVVVGRATSTEVRAYDGQVEQFASATSAGVGVRVIAGNRQGFAYAGTLDADVMAETLAEARDNATFATDDEWLGLAEPDGVAVPALDLYRESLTRVSTDAKIDLALELERAVRAADPRITGVESADYADGVSEGAVVSTTGIRTYGRETSCYVAAHCVATDGDDTQTGFGFSVGRTLDDLDVSVAAGDAARRATRLLGATKPASGRVTVVLDPYVTAQFLGIIGSTLSGEAVLKGRSLFADRLGESVAAAGSPWSTTPPTRWPTAPARPTVRAWRRAATCSSTAGCSNSSCTTPTPPVAPAPPPPPTPCGAIRPRPGWRAGRCRWHRAPGSSPSSSPAWVTAC